MKEAVNGCGWHNAHKKARKSTFCGMHESLLRFLLRFLLERSNRLLDIFITFSPNHKKVLIPQNTN
jgi:hypothetical protein